MFCSGEFMDNLDLKRIKKHYGENFAKLCRELFPTILETPGALSKIIFEKFDPSPTLYEDVLKIKDGFKNFVFSFFIKQNNDKLSASAKKTAKELFDDAGYILYPECKTEADIQKFKKYYAPYEELCTFNGNRLNSCRVWFAVKKDVNRIKREDFENPQRQDKYGTSVISIQFTKSKKSTVSIKNRYNHSVNNPDATFGNNLENIALGLTDAFCKDYGINLAYQFSHMLDLDGYVLGNDGKFYKSNVKTSNNTYYCANNTIVEYDGKIVRYDKSKYVLMENYLVDLVTKKIINLDTKRMDSFIKSIGPIKSIHISLDANKNRVISIDPFFGKEIKIVTDKANQIIEYSNPNLKRVGDEFLYWNEKLTKLDVPNLEEVGDWFLFSNRSLNDANMPSLKIVKDSFLVNNGSLKKLDLPQLKDVGNDFLHCNTVLSEINIPSLESVEDGFLFHNQNVQSIHSPNLKRVGGTFLAWNNRIKKLDLPNLTEVGYWFCKNNTCIAELNLPNLSVVGNNFMHSNQALQKLSLPSLKIVESNFLSQNRNIQEIYLPNLERVGAGFLCNNTHIEKIDLPNLVEAGDWFCQENARIYEISLPNLRKVGCNFLYSNQTLTKLSLPNLVEAGRNFLNNNRYARDISLPKLYYYFWSKVIML